MPSYQYLKFTWIWFISHKLYMNLSCICPKDWQYWSVFQVGSETSWLAGTWHILCALFTLASFSSWSCRNKVWLSTINQNKSVVIAHLHQIPMAMKAEVLQWNSTAVSECSTAKQINVMERACVCVLINTVLPDCLAFSLTLDSSSPKMQNRVNNPQPLVICTSGISRCLCIS